jgi:DNA-binding response OmpR family regulator
MDASALIVEDDRDLAELMAIYLGDEGIEGRIAGTAEEGLGLLGSGAFDLVLLDLSLPCMDGFEFLRRLRSSSDLPVMIVSSREADEDMILALGLGADEFVSKPFSPRVLAARAKAHLRRARGNTPAAAPNVLRLGNLRVDLESMLVEREGLRLPMPAKELDLLVFLLRHRGEVLESEAIYREVWNNPYGDMATVAVHVQRLRRRIEPDPASPRYIKTVYGVGYRLDAPGDGPGEIAGEGGRDTE